MASTDSSTEASEMPFSAESHMTFLSPPPAPGQVTPASSSQSESEFSSGEDDMQNAEDNEEDEEDEDEDDEEDEDEDENQEGEVEDAKEVEIEEEKEDGPQSNDAGGVNAALAVDNVLGNHTPLDFMSFRPAMYRQRYNEREETMYAPRTVFQGLQNRAQLPPLPVAKVEELKRKWRDVHILELEAFIRRFALLQEECETCLAELKRRCS